MTDHLTDTNVGNIEYISKQDAIDAIHCDITITGRENAETVCKAIASFTDGIKAIEHADVVRVDSIIQFIESRKQLHSSPAWYEFAIVKELDEVKRFVEKIGAYEEKKKEIHFGDEIRNKQKPDIRVCVTNVRGDRWDGFALSDVGNYCRFGSGYNDRYLDGWEKTGRNFATILQQIGVKNVEQK